jgi:hypothetical protein
LEVLCTRCSRRQAVYFRRHSGERLCLGCLYRSIVKEIKRAFSTVGSVGPGLRVGVLVSETLVLESALLLKVLGEVEERYSGLAIAVTCGDVLEEYLAVIRRYSKDVVPCPELGDSEIVCVRLPKGLDWLRLDLLAVPVTLDDLLECFLRSLLYEHEVRNVGTYAELQHLKVFAPLHRVPRVDLVAYAFLAGVLDEVSCTKVRRPPDAIGKLVTAISIKHPELLFRFLYGAFSREDLRTSVLGRGMGCSQVGSSPV